MDTMQFLNLIEETEAPSDVRYPEQTAFLTRKLLESLGEDPNREGLERTPERVARMYEELLAGYHMDPIALVNGAIFQSDYKNMVLVRDIEFYSLCEHHLLPFYGRAHLAYVPDGKIIGLSKIPRLVDMFARRLQVQERMTQQIAEGLEDILQPKGVAVLVEGAHLCAMMRGVKKADAKMITSAFLGDFEVDDSLRSQFLSQIPQSR